MLVKVASVFANSLDAFYGVLRRFEVSRCGFAVSLR
jgi:hypothetical protein